MTVDQYAPFVVDGDWVRLSDIGLEARITPAPSSNRKEHMPAQNPYERRGRDGEHRTHGAAMEMHRLEVEPPPSARLRAADLDALMARAYERGAEDARTQQAEARFDAEREKGRMAWEEGYTAGRRELAAGYDERFGKRVHDHHERLVALLTNDARGVKRENLVRWLRQSVMLCEALIEGHRELERGTETEIPF